MIIYFSGTGNSRRIAQVMASVTGDTVTDAATYFKKKEYPTLESAKPYIFVFPTYAWKMPRILEAWILNSKFTAGQSAYFVMTCGDGIGAAEIGIKRLCKKKGLKFMGVHKIVMPENYICMFKAPEPQEAKRIVQSGEALAGTLVRDYIIPEDPFPKASGSPVLSCIVNPLFYKTSMSDKPFTTGESCIGCGICANACPVGNIAIEGGKPKWKGGCIQCQACINICPRTAIEYGEKTKGKTRYFLAEKK